MKRSESAALFLLAACLLCNLPRVAHPQESAKCTTVNATIELKSPPPGEYWFRYHVRRDIWVYMRPADVVDYWRNIFIDLDRADLLESQLPLQAHADVADIVPFSSRIMTYPVADLIHAGKAAVWIDEEGFLPSVLLEQKYGPPCNSTRDFFKVHDDGTRTRLVHISDLVI